LFGWKRFLVLFFGGGIFSNLSAFLFYQNSGVLGASGAISALIFSYVILRPRAIGFFLGVPMRMWVMAFFWFITNLALLGRSNIAVEAHLFGALFGIIFGGLNRRRFFEKEEKKEEEYEVSEKEIEEWEEKYMKSRVS
jgi:membrane associated rhomboid family serine protease